jgi:hypothetical protein
MKKLIALALLIPCVANAGTASATINNILATGKWNRQEWAKISAKQAGAECKADIAKQRVAVDSGWMDEATEPAQDIHLDLSKEMAQMELVKMFAACMEGKGWKFVPGSARPR